MIEVKGLSKQFRLAKRKAGFGAAVKALFNREYETVQALEDVSFSIAEGEMVGYIGPNGAGKSTTIKIMSGILHPDGGTCTIAGRTPWHDRIAHVRDIGVVFGQRSQLWWDVPVGDSFALLKDIYHIEDRAFRQTLHQLTDLLDIGELIKVPTRQLSLGQRMKCEIAASLLHRPSVLFLDEPTIGLDAVAKIAVRDFIKTLNAEEKTTVILTTHDTADIEALTQRIILIGKGQVLHDGALTELKEKFSADKTVTIDYRGTLHNLPSAIELLQQYDGRAVLRVTDMSTLLSYLAETVELLDLRVNEASMDDVVVSLYKEFHI